MQRARRVATCTLVLAMAASGVALAGDPPESRAGSNSAPAAPMGAARAGQPATVEGAATDDTAHHAPPPAPAPPTKAEADAELSRSASASRSAMANVDGADWGARLGRAEVERVQRELSARGVYQGAIDGVVGPKTLAALQNFQAQQGLPAHARLDAQTRRALGLELDMQPVSGDEASTGPGLEPSVGRDGAAAGSTPLSLDRLDSQQLGALQTRLAELGFYRGSVDGKLGAGTRSALQRFFQAQLEHASRGVLTEPAASWLGVEPSATPDARGASEPAATMPHPQPSTP